MNFYERINYNPATGQFTWAVSAPGIRAGKRAGAVSVYGYRVIKVGGRQVRACRLAWFLTHSEWPVAEIDHIDGDRLNDRIENLRVVDRAANSQNKGGAQRNNRSCGLLGVTWNKQHKRWQAKITARKARHHIGYFNSPEKAHAAYMEAKARLHIGGRGH